MSQAGEARLSAVDDSLDALGATPGLADELFAVVDVLGTSAGLRKALSDSAVDPAARERLVGAVFGGKVSDAAVRVVTAASAVRWPSAGALVGAIERQGVRAEILTAEQNGSLGELEDELFRFSRLVTSEPELREALGNRAAPLELRHKLVTDLLQGRAGESTVRLARRAVAARERTFATTVAGYLDLVAAHQRRTIATVTVARPLDEAQIDRLTAALGRQLGRAVLIQVVVDPSVIGGIRVQVGDEIIEGTMAGRLDEARRSLGG